MTKSSPLHLPAALLLLLLLSTGTTTTVGAFSLLKLFGMDDNKASSPPPPASYSGGGGSPGTNGANDSRAITGYGTGDETAASEDGGGSAGWGLSSSVLMKFNKKNK
jgi:hypothetical protein